MSIKIVVQGDSYMPRVFCDYCNSEIATGEEGNYDWADSDLPTATYFTHKNCSDPFRAEHPEINMHDELMVLPLRLSANMRIDAVSAREADKMGRME